LHKFGLIPRNWLLNTVYSKKELRTLAVLFLKYGIKEVSSRQEKKAKEIAI